MDAYMDIKRTALVWNVTERRVNELCKTGRIEGAYKKDGRWFIPSDAEKPADKRYKISLPALSTAARLLPLPIGITDFRKASTEYLYMDKTLLIRDLLDEKTQVSIFARPKRFGKTLNMDMIKTFFERCDKDTSIYFRDLSIWSAGEEYRQQQGKYPVIFLSFKDANYDNWADTRKEIEHQIIGEFERHNIEKPVNFLKSLEYLSSKLDDIYHRAPIIIIDEYDTPIMNSKIYGYYDEAAAYINQLYSGAFRDNRHLTFGFLSGILDLSDDVKSYTILDKKYSKYFGFTYEEIQRICSYYNKSEEYEKITRWYDGYPSGSEPVLNPWSVINCVDEECAPRTFWPGNDTIIYDILSDAKQETVSGIEMLIQGRSFITHIDNKVMFPDVKGSPSAVYSYLLMSGYIKAVNKDRQYDGSYMCEVSVPNKEIMTAFSKDILRSLEYIIPKTMVISVHEALFAKNQEVLVMNIEDFLNRAAMLSDVSDDAPYHVAVLGLCAMLTNHYYFSFTKRSTPGNYGIVMTPLEEKLPGIMIELKSVRTVTSDDLESVAYAAIDQLLRMQYDPETKSRYTRQIIKFGVAFNGKDARVIWE